MCKKTNYKTSNPRIDKCMRNLIENLIWMTDGEGWQPVASCCGHGKYPMTLVFKSPHGKMLEVFSDKYIDRKRNFYKKDKQGYYYIPEVLEDG